MLPERKAISTFQHLGGKQIILKFVMNAEDNQRFFYQLDGEGIRYEIVAFAKSIEVKKPMNYVEKAVSKSIAKIIESFNDRADMIVI